MGREAAAVGQCPKGDHAVGSRAQEVIGIATGQANPKPDGAEKFLSVDHFILASEGDVANTFGIRRGRSRPSRLIKRRAIRQSDVERDTGERKFLVDTGISVAAGT